MAPGVVAPRRLLLELWPSFDPSSLVSCSRAATLWRAGVFSGRGIQSVVMPDCCCLCRLSRSEAWTLNRDVMRRGDTGISSDRMKNHSPQQERDGPSSRQLVPLVRACNPLYAMGQRRQDIMKGAH